MGKLIDELVSREEKRFKWALGTIGASAFAGFLAGLLVASIFFFTLFDLSLKS